MVQLILLQLIRGATTLQHPSQSKQQVAHIHALVSSSADTRAGPVSLALIQVLGQKPPVPLEGWAFRNCSKWVQGG